MVTASPMDGFLLVAKSLAWFYTTPLFTSLFINVTADEAL